MRSPVLVFALAALAACTTRSTTPVAEPAEGAASSAPEFEPEPGESENVADGSGEASASEPSPPTPSEGKKRCHEEKR